MTSYLTLPSKKQEAYTITVEQYVEAPYRYEGRILISPHAGVQYGVKAIKPFRDRRGLQYLVHTTVEDLVVEPGTPLKVEPYAPALV